MKHVIWYKIEESSESGDDKKIEGNILLKNMWLTCHVNVRNDA